MSNPNAAVIDIEALSFVHEVVVHFAHALEGKRVKVGKRDRDVAPKY